MIVNVQAIGFDIGRFTRAQIRERDVEEAALDIAGDVASALLDTVAHGSVGHGKVIIEFEEDGRILARGILHPHEDDDFVLERSEG